MPLLDTVNGTITSLLSATLRLQPLDRTSSVLEERRLSASIISVAQFDWRKDVAGNCKVIPVGTRSFPRCENFDTLIGDFRSTLRKDLDLTFHHDWLCLWTIQIYDKARELETILVKAAGLSREEYQLASDDKHPTLAIDLTMQFQ